MNCCCLPRKVFLQTCWVNPVWKMVDTGVVVPAVIAGSRSPSQLLSGSCRNSDRLHNLQQWLPVPLHEFLSAHVVKGESRMRKTFKSLCPEAPGSYSGPTDRTRLSLCSNIWLKHSVVYKLKNESLYWKKKKKNWGLLNLFLGFLMLILAFASLHFDVCFKQSSCDTRGI